MSVIKNFYGHAQRRTGLVDAGTAARAGELASADFIVTGTVSEIGDNIVINCRMIDTSTGNVLSSIEVSIPRDEIIAESKELYFSAFQSDYGLNIGFNPGILYASEDFNRKLFQFHTFDISYRLFRNTNAGIGYFFMGCNEFIIERISYGANSDVHRNFNFEGSGPLFFIEYCYPVFRWFNVGARAEYMFFSTHLLTQDLASLRVGYVEPSGTPDSINERVLIESWANEKVVHIARGSLKLEFLISKRLSLHLLGGYVLATDYEPDVYESGGVRQWTEDTDTNGRFSQYGDYNFSRFDDGSRVKFNFSGYSLTMGAGIHF